MPNWRTAISYDVLKVMITKDFTYMMKTQFTIVKNETAISTTIFYDRWHNNFDVTVINMSKLADGSSCTEQTNIAFGKVIQSEVAV